MSPSTLAHLEELKPAAVAKLLAQHEFGVPGSDLRLDVESWLKAKELEASSRKEFREEESLNIARAALSNSSAARRMSTFALIVSATAIIISAIANKSHIAAFIQSLLP